MNGGSQLNVNAFNSIQNGTTIVLGNGSTLVVGANNGSSAFVGTLKDLTGQTTIGTLTKSGTGTLTLSGTSSGFSGGVTLNAGALGAGSSTALGTGSITGNGGALFATGGDRTLTNAISVNSGKVLNVVTVPADVHNLTLNGPISGAGGLNVNAPGATVTLGGSSVNAFGGLTSVTAGTLALNTFLTGDVSIGNAVNPGPAGSAVFRINQSNGIFGSNVTIFSDGLLDMNSNTISISALTMTGGEIRTGNAFLLTLFNNGVTVNASAAGAKITSPDFAARISLPPTPLAFTIARGTATYDLNIQAGMEDGQLVKKGPGVLRLGSVNQFNFSVALQQGTVAVGNDRALGQALSLGSAPLFTFSGGTLVADGGDRTIANPINLTGSATIGASVDGTPRAISLTGPMTIIASETLTINNDAPTTLANLILNGKALTLAGSGNTEITGPITRSGSLTKTGTGTVTLTANNTFSGGLLITGGTLIAQNDSALGDPSGAITLFNTGRLTFADAAVTTGRTFNLSTGTLSPAPGGSITYSSSAMVNGGNLGAGSHRFANGSGLNGVRAGNGTALNQTGGVVAFNNVLLSGNSSFAQAAGSSLNITADFNTEPLTSMTLNGTVNILGGSISGAVAVNSGGTLANAASPLFLDGSHGVTIIGGGKLSSTSGSTLELGGLLVNNGTQTGVLDVNLGGVAKGTGAFGTVNVNSGGKFSPGNSPGAATVSSLLLGSGASYQFEIHDANGSAGNGIDFIHDLGSLTLSAGTTLNTIFTINAVTLDAANQPGAAINFDPSQPHSFVLVTADGGITGFNPSEFTVDTSGFRNDLAGGSFSVVRDGNNLDLAFSPVPEPSAALAMVVASGMGLLARSGKTCRRSSAIAPLL